ncbi:MAG: hypothetical protein JXR73_04770 [Candidatus Omnitrophica bacterium]|nr:hypothetical protein [Candidatus Omnitrophota bacterium]
MKNRIAAPASTASIHNPKQSSAALAHSSAALAIYDPCASPSWMGMRPYLSPNRRPKRFMDS